MSVIGDEIDIMSLFKDALLKLIYNSDLPRPATNRKTVTIRYKNDRRKKTAKWTKPAKRMKPNKNNYSILLNLNLYVTPKSATRL